MLNVVGLWLNADSYISRIVQSFQVIFMKLYSVFRKKTTPLIIYYFFAKLWTSFTKLVSMYTRKCVLSFTITSSYAFVQKSRTFDFQSDTLSCETFCYFASIICHESKKSFIF